MVDAGAADYFLSGKAEHWLPSTRRPDAGIG